MYSEIIIVINYNCHFFLGWNMSILIYNISPIGPCISYCNVSILLLSHARKYDLLIISMNIKAYEQLLLSN